ncbi:MULTISPECIES: hypothetical protein [unclassified Micromonospora]|uniref:hypothetical protein n=1 Tax=unclassified Micromonospora TaxID=2617518 RepID=UPI00331D742A
MVTTLTSPTPSRRPCTILVALNEADATWWQFVTDPDHVYLTQRPAPQDTGLQPTAVHITPDARRGDHYRPVMDLVHRQLAAMRPHQRPPINRLDEHPGRGEKPQ